jgi:hypothetical protein
MHDNSLLCLTISLTTAVAVIAVFNYYVAVARDKSLR